jgi:hypothetical protein
MGTLTEPSGIKNMGKSLANHPKLNPRHFNKWGEPAYVAEFLREVGYPEVIGIWGDRDSSGKQLSFPDPNGLKIAAQRGGRDIVNGDERAKRIQSRIQFARKFAGLSRDVRATRIGSKEAPSRELLVEKSKAIELPDEWIYSGENPWFPPRPSYRTKIPTCVTIGDVPDFIRSYVSLVSYADWARVKFHDIASQFSGDSFPKDDFNRNFMKKESHQYFSLRNIRDYCLILAAAKGHSHPSTDADNIKTLITKEVLGAASLVSKWIPFFVLFEKADLEIMQNNKEITFNPRFTIGDISTATNAMNYLLELIESGRVTDMEDFAPAIRQTQSKIYSAFQFNKLDDSMLGKHRREQSKKGNRGVSC